MSKPTPSAVWWFAVRLFWALAAILFLARPAAPAENCRDGRCRPPLLAGRAKGDTPRITVYETAGDIGLLSGCLVWAHPSADQAIVATAAHAFRNPFDRVEVDTGSDQYLADVAHVDHVWDIALLRIRRPRWNTWRIADQPPAIGTPIYAAGYPGGRGLRVKSGHITNRAAPITSNQMDLIVARVSTSDGQSGGPIYDHSGRLVGIISGADGGDTVGPGPTRLRAALDLLLSQILPATRRGAEGTAPDAPAAGDMDAAGPAREPLAPVRTPDRTATVPYDPDDFWPAIMPGSPGDGIDSAGNPTPPPSPAAPADAGDNAARPGGDTNPLAILPDTERRQLLGRLADVAGTLERTAAGLGPAAPAGAVDPLAAGLPALLAGLGITAPPAAAVVAGLWFARFAIRRRRQRKGAAAPAADQFPPAATIPRADREAVEHLRLGGLEGRSPLHDAIVGQIAFDELARTIDAQPGTPQADWADELRRTLER